jgi:hypothetical protein
MILCAPFYANMSQESRCNKEGFGIICRKKYHGWIENTEDKTHDGCHEMVIVFLLLLLLLL